jgi:hypothetical protein
MLERRLWLLAGLVAAVCVLRSPGAPISEGKTLRPSTPGGPLSHRLLPNSNFDPLAAEDIISARLNGENRGLRDLKSLFNNKAVLKELTKGLLTEEQMLLLDANSEKVQQLLGDPRFREFLEDSINVKKEGRQLSEEQIATLKRLAESNLDPNSIEAPTGAGGANRSQNQGQDRDRTAAQTHGGARVDPQVEDTGTQQEKHESWLDRQMARIGEAIAEEMKNPANAGAFQDALRSLGGIKEGDDGREQFDFRGLWKSAAADAAGWVASRWEWPGVLAAAPRELYRDLQAALPELEGSVTGALAKVPTDKLGGGPGGTGVPVEQLAWVVFAVVMVAIAWQSIGKRVAARVGPGNLKLGPWPVQPNSVADRNDIVLAFEYLALLRLGASARAANHLAVAKRLKAEEVDEERRNAAGALARLYERVRYEPHPEPLGEKDLAAARQNLAMLARATAA